MLSPVRVLAPNDIAMYTELVYTYIASMIGLLLTPPSLTLCCVAPFCVLSACWRAWTYWGRHLDVSGGLAGR